MPFSKKLKEQMLGQNALDWLGLAREQFVPARKARLHR
jgi:hypothetical protein